MSCKEKIAARAAREVQPGQVINLGIGIPTMIPEYLPDATEVFIQSENGILGIGPRCRTGTEDRNIIDAGANYVTLAPGASFFDSALSFALIRGGRVDLSFLGTLQVSVEGDLANWIIPGKMAPGIGGGMELAQKGASGGRHDLPHHQGGRPQDPPLLHPSPYRQRLRQNHHYRTGGHRRRPEGLMLRELARETSLEEVREKTGAPLLLPEGEIPRF